MKPAVLLARCRQGHYANIRLADVHQLLLAVGFVYLRTEGSHRIYGHPDIPADPADPDATRVNLQEVRGGQAKPYQVRQIVRLIDQFGLSFPKRS